MKITRKMVGSEAKNPRARSRDKVEAFPSKLDGYGPRKGLEGPFLMKNGRVVYYDPAEGAYYDPGTDFYLSKDEAARLHSNPARKPARSKAQNLAIALSEQRAGHPRKAAEFFKAAARAKNPLVETVHWSVHKPAMPPHLAIAFYSNKKDAIEAAREAAQRTGKPLAVSKHKTYHFVPEKVKTDEDWLNDPNWVGSRHHY